MKSHTLSKIIGLIVLLLLSQVSSAYAVAFSAESTDSGAPCSMSQHQHMQHDAHMNDSMHSDMAKSGQINSNHQSMDCCDNTAVTACCDGDCQCVTIAGSALFMPLHWSEQITTISELVKSSMSLDVLGPFLTLLIRPPINTVL